MVSGRHYRKCAYCGRREYGDNIAKRMRLASYGLHDRSESHFVHNNCDGDYCRHCGASLTEADREAKACTQCWTPIR